VRFASHTSKFCLPFLFNRVLSVRIRDRNSTDVKSARGRGQHGRGMGRYFLRSRFSIRVNPFIVVRPRTATLFATAAAAAVHDPSSSTSTIVSWRSQASNPCLETPSQMSWSRACQGPQVATVASENPWYVIVSPSRSSDSDDSSHSELMRELASSPDRRVMQCISAIWPRSCSSFLSYPSTGIALPCGDLIALPITLKCS
jgi:hypothetical protein